MLRDKENELKGYTKDYLIKHIVSIEKENKQLKAVISKYIKTTKEINDTVDKIL